MSKRQSKRTSHGYQSSEDEVEQFLDEVFTFPKDNDPRVRVTLTFAQSLDSKIAGANGKQLTLSCKESMHMTHMMRARHDTILVGIGTALNDNPQLNIRLLTPKDGETAPVPVILDTDLRFSLDSKLAINFRSGKGERPILVTKKKVKGSEEPEWDARKRALEEAGLLVIEVPLEHGRLSIKRLLLELQDMGVKSLMVEGGASVISSFIGSGLVDRLVVTVCPTLVGDEGVAYNVGTVPSLEYMRSQSVGRDTVMAWRGWRLGFR
ncbi:bacterial bifunctional deaminase-reductase [Schizopora paradoxa]|uniref:2,5-diamino-6-ribosylamino-4(3H)-pyrimidinone 5'-phosphate reductase n=1 Tax=Schizopora paradoxa TaxID=27342 RepID=A0A0H2SED4_9AGAM|nr:bacterial bifunctional deaminase-reductase [Schizopora paradoxa]